MALKKLFVGMSLLFPIAFSAQAQVYYEGAPSYIEDAKVVDDSRFSVVNGLRQQANLLLAQSESEVDLKGMPILRFGDFRPEVASLRQALMNKGFEIKGVTVETDLHVFDEEVQSAVLAAQENYAIRADGIAGPELYGRLSASNRLVGVKLLEYANQLNAQLEDATLKGQTKAIVVNVPAYQLTAVDLITGESKITSKVIVGMSGKTPIFTTNIINLKYNPDWSPPPSLAAKGKRYVAPGPNNPLGKIRFSTDNNVFIYLHHTNEPHLFERSTRALSSGCVRVEQWDTLAAFLVDQPVEYIHAKVDAKKLTYDKVTPTPVFLNYSTVDVIDGVPVQFSDVYRREKN